jgi:hypothetical protein
MNLFEEVYSQNPPSVLSYIPSTLKVQEVEKIITFCKDILCSLKDNLVLVQNHVKKQVDQGCSELHFVEGDQVFLRLQRYKNISLKSKHCQKLSPKFYGPYIVLKNAGSVAYQLALPNQSKIHHVFHVSFLNKVIGTNFQTQTSLPELDEEGSIWLQPQEVLVQ